MATTKKKTTTRRAKTINVAEAMPTVEQVRAFFIERLGKTLDISINGQTFDLPIADLSADGMAYLLRYGKRTINDRWNNSTEKKDGKAPKVFVDTYVADMNAGRLGSRGPSFADTVEEVALYAARRFYAASKAEFDAEHKRTRDNPGTVFTAEDVLQAAFDAAAPKLIDKIGQKAFNAKAATIRERLWWTQVFPLIQAEYDKEEERRTKPTPTKVVDADLDDLLADI